MSHANRLFHTVSEFDYGSDESFLTWILCILTNTFVVTSTDSHSSNGNTKFVKRERDLRDVVPGFPWWFWSSAFVLKSSTDPQDRAKGHRKGNNYSCQEMQKKTLWYQHRFSRGNFCKGHARRLTWQGCLFGFLRRLFALPIWKLEFHEIFFNIFMLPQQLCFVSFVVSK